MLFFKIVVFIVTLSFLVFREFSAAKDIEDDKGFPFDAEVWFDKIWDNLLVYCLGAFLLAALSSEIAVPIINQYTDFAEYTDSSIELTGVAICTIAGFRLSRFLKK